MSKKADFQARIKRIEIANRVLKGGWRQSIRVVLDDIALTNDNLLELRQFRPNESVAVIIRPVPVIDAANAASEEVPLVEIYEGGAAPCPGRVEKAWEF